ncbi:super-infection exclusion protein B [Salinivibrio sp. HTSP]|uniref:super-infection exclusion protein B n=1 Tax=Salinivibrio sp. HTSP TaxID=2115977 RepID=UPI000E30DDB0|nr:super-infection exclusion protein B [Salinivibrio sp. HTSP]
MKALDKWAERIYSENDFGRGVATSVSGTIGLSTYLFFNDWVIALFGVMISFPVIRIAASNLYKWSQDRAKKKSIEQALECTFNGLTEHEKLVVAAFVEAGGTALTFSQINRLDLSSSAIESLVQKELLWTSVMSDGMSESFVLDMALFEKALSENEPAH